MVTTIATDYREEFETSEGDIITTPGKFEGEHISVPYFWDGIMNGDCESCTIGDDNSAVSFFVIGDTERDEFPDLKDMYGLALYETSEGFIHSVWFESRSEYQEAKDNPEEVL